MTDLQTKTTRTAKAANPINTAAIKKVLSKILTYVPAVIIFGLIALYYIQLSHMA